MNSKTLEMLQKFVGEEDNEDFENLGEKINIFGEQSNDNNEFDNEFIAKNDDINRLFEKINNLENEEIDENKIFNIKENENINNNEEEEKIDKNINDVDEDEKENNINSDKSGILLKMISIREKHDFSIYFMHWKQLNLINQEKESFEKEEINNNNIENINNNNENNNQIKPNLVKSESFNYLESMERLKNKYKDVDLNSIHFYPQNRRDIEIRKLIIKKKLNFNKLKNNVINNKRSVNEFEFSPNPKLLDDSKNPQIAKLKKEINYGYMQISSAIKNLRKNIIQADNNKLKAEKELKLINTDFSKEQKYQLQLDKIEYDKRKKDNTYINNYNNDFYKYTNINDIDPMYYNIAPVVQSNMNNNKNEMSNLAKVGQNLIKLNSESEFIPIGMNYYYKNMYENIGVNEGIQMENKTEHDELKHETVFEPSDD